MDSSEILMDQSISCDRCGKKISNGEIHKTDELIALCLDCLEYLETLSEYVRKDIKERLIGNVL